MGIYGGCAAGIASGWDVAGGSRLQVLKPGHSGPKFREKWYLRGKPPLSHSPLPLITIERRIRANQEHGFWCQTPWVLPLFSWWSWGRLFIVFLSQFPSL